MCIVIICVYIYIYIYMYIYPKRAIGCPWCADSCMTMPTTASSMQSCMFYSIVLYVLFAIRFAILLYST